MATGAPVHPLRAAREAAPHPLCTQVGLANEAGVSHSLISMLESGYVPARSVTRLEAVAAALGASYGSFWPNGNGAG